MTKTISFELSKRLDKLGLLRDVETEYVFQEGIKSTIGKGGAITFSGDGIFKIKSIKELHKGGYIFYKTLTTDEAIEFLKNIGIIKECVPFIDIINTAIYYDGPTLLVAKKGKTILQAIEKMITYLLDKDLIGPTKIN